MSEGVEEKIFNEWLFTNFNKMLPDAQDDAHSPAKIFNNLWNEGRITYTEIGNDFDVLDSLTAKLTSHCLINKQSLLIILPDTLSKRSASIFTTSLIISSIQLLDSKLNSRNVLYFGSSIGIRRNLSTVDVGNYNLSSVFNQYYGRGSLDVEHSTFTTLPNVYCIYSPVNPIESIIKYKPMWVAIDCGTEIESNWLKTLVKYLLEKKIPCIAWITNPFSNIRNIFNEVELPVFMWPAEQIFKENYKYSSLSSTEDILSYFVKKPVKTELQGYVIKFNNDSNLAQCFIKSRNCLAQLAKMNAGRFESDALHIGRRYYNALERIIIPIQLYDAEAKNFWGIIPISNLKEGFSKFVSQYYKVGNEKYKLMETLQIHLDTIYRMFLESEPPLWKALLDIIHFDLIKKDKNQNLILAFPNQAYKSIFLFTLLSRLNIDEEDLRSLNIFILSIKELTAWINSICQDKIDVDLQSIFPKLGTTKDVFENDIILLTSMPNYYSRRQMQNLFYFKKLNFLIYEHQFPDINLVSKFWKNNIKNDLDGMKKLFESLLKVSTDIKFPQERSPLLVQDPEILNIEYHKKGETIPKKNFSNLFSPIDDIEYVFGSKEENPLSIEEKILNIDQIGDDFEESIVENVMEIEFHEGYSGIFDLNSKLIVIKSKSNNIFLEESYVRALRENDRIVYISESKRQNLYYLILHRVHDHPSIEIHLALISRWQSEIKEAYDRWRKNGNSFEKIFDEMKKNGSGFSSASSLRPWINGNIFSPHDVEDMLRISTILNMPFTKKHYKRIFKAGRRIHGLHISLSQRIGYWIKNYDSSDSTKDIIDEEIGLTINDIKDSLLILSIKSCEVKKGLYSKSNIDFIKEN